MRRVRLLVSVTDHHEAAEALAGGADIIDAKDPSKGALGALGPEVWAKIWSACPPGAETSAALGDLGASLTAPAAPGSRVGPPTYVKVGVGGFPDAGSALSALREFTADRFGSGLPGRAARLHGAGPEESALGPPSRLIVAGYADYERAHTPPPAALPELALAAGAGGCLLDTAIKDGSCLLDWIDPPRLRGFVEECHARGLLCALAGSLHTEHLSEVAPLCPDFIGVRGAACDGDRIGGRVTRSSVAVLAYALANAPAA